jgi:hypothetical protein
MAALLPEPLLPVLAEPLLLAPLTALLDGSHAAMHRLLAAQAQRGGFRQLLQLHKLGRALGIEAWQEPVLQLMLASSAAGAASAAADEAAAGSAAVLQQGAGSGHAAAAAAAADHVAVEELLRSFAAGPECSEQPGALGQQQDQAAEALGDGQRQQEVGEEEDWELLGGSSPRQDARGDSPAGTEAPRAASAASQQPSQLDPAAAAAVEGAAAGGPTPQQLVVQSIRQGEFGVGVDLGGEAGELASRQNERIGRALKRLSRDLYSKDTHFVLELVQVGAGSRQRAVGRGAPGVPGRAPVGWRCVRHAACVLCGGHIGSAAAALSQADGPPE